ncbi:MAG: aminoglycoside phosphotransferase family protein [Rhodoglobus sp.]
MDVAAGLTEPQAIALAEWLGDWELIADMSWPLLHTRVLHIRTSDGEFVVKASRPDSRPGSTAHHVLREIDAHLELSGRLGPAATRLRHSSAALSILVTDYLPGELVHGSASEWDPAIYEQAGRMLRRITEPRRASADYVRDLVARARASAERAAGLLDPEQLAELEAVLATVQPGTVELSFTHGDYQPRNWLDDHGVLRVIDFGRGGWRHWTSDLVRMRHQQLLGHPELESAFFAGFGAELSAEEQAHLRLEELEQAVSTVVWAHAVGDAGFEEQGRGMVARVLA